MDTHNHQDALISLQSTHDALPAIEPEEEADVHAAAIDVPDDTADDGRLRMIVQLVKRSFGVKDLAAM
jgi:oxysterol-binding protein-related protein 9/10/11